MILLADLPPELLIHILSLVGSNLRSYSQKERQGDLAVFALVHSSFLAPAQHLLYTGNVLIRNAGRSSLLARTLSANPELAALVRQLTIDSHQSHHPPSLVNILQCTYPCSLTLDGSVFQAGEASMTLYELLLLRRESMISFTWRGDLSNFDEAVEHLLRSWSGLEHLSLEFAIGSWPERLDRRPKPTYRLESLALPNDPWRVEDLQWLLGSTTTQLRRLTLGRPHLATTPHWNGSVLCPDEEPDRFTHLLQHLTSLQYFPTYVDLTNFALILARTTALRHLSFASRFLGIEKDNISGSPPGPIPLPPLLETLELHRSKNIKQFRLVEALEGKDRPPALHSICLHRLFPTDEDAREVKRVCQAEGIALEVRPF